MVVGNFRSLRAAMGLTGVSEDHGVSERFPVQYGECLTWVEESIQI